MSYLKRPFALGSTILPSNIFYAPLAGCSDFPFRQMSSRYKPGLIYCEMVKMEALIRNDPNTYHMLDFNKEMHPIGAQICGSKPGLAAKAAKIIENLGFDVLDLNCGCPVDKVTKDGSGSAMLKTPHLIGEIIANMVAAVKIPVTVKIRAGWNEHTINAVEITKIAEAAGAKAICIHGRTREQAYRGPANWDYIKQCKEVAKNIKIIGNGDIVDSKSAKGIFEQTGCDAILVARGTMGHPWIVEDIMAYLSNEEPKLRTLEDCREGLLQHFHCIMDYHPDRRAAVDIRRVGCWYLKKSQGTKGFRELISKVDNCEKALEIIRNFPLGELGSEAGETGEETETCDQIC